MTDYSIAHGLLLGMVAIPHIGSCQVQQRRLGAVYSVLCCLKAKKDIHQQTWIVEGQDEGKNPVCKWKGTNPRQSSWHFFTFGENDLLRKTHAVKGTAVIMTVKFIKWVRVRSQPCTVWPLCRSMSAVLKSSTHSGIRSRQCIFLH